MTLMLRPECRPEKASALTLVMALAVLEAMREFMPLDKPMGIKWPNDIVIDNKKACGILTEMSAELDGIHYVVIGVGINVNQTEFSDEISKTATSMFIENGDKINRSRLVARVMHYFEKDYEIFEKTWDLTGLVDKYNKYLVNCGKEVRVLDPKGEYDAIAEGINENGELIVRRKDNGETVLVYAGEVSVRGVYGYAI
jgi:BirA family biotin operon repressor/biotin-[acetyl-CoA-carboxylase] ligase